MLNDAVSHYHELLKDSALAQSSLEFLDRGLERAKLIFGGRRLSPYLRPHFITKDDFTQVVRVCETIWSAIEKVKDAALADESLLDELGLTAIERELVKIDPGYRAVSPTARLDSFLTDETYSFVELNGESPAGIAYGDAAFAIFEELPVMKRFAEKYDVRRFEGSPLMLKVLLDCHQEFLGRKPDRAPHIAIVDLKGMPTQKEFELFREYFESQSCPSIIASPDELEFTDGRLRVRDFEIDIVYKRLLVNEYLPIMKEQPALLDAYRAGAVCMVNGFRSKIIHKKALFAVLTDARFKSLFTSDEQKMIAGHVPWTRKVRAGKSDYYGDQIDLLEFISDRRDRLVLKPNDDYGGHGIYIGWNIDEIGWDEAIHNALANGDYLVQERVATARETFPALTPDDKIQFVEQLVDLDPLLFNGKVGSAFTRLSSNELANVTAGGGMVPTFVIEKR
jgi:uncharacterized circularly permuted ATP-grasp superfamily protein